MEKNKSINFLLILVVLFFVFKIFSVFNTNLELYGDEAQYWLWSKDLSAGYYSKPPLIAFLLRFFSSVFGNSFFSIKLLPLTFYLFSSFAVFFLAKILYDKKIGILSGITFILLPGVSLSSFLISTDVPLILFWTSALIFFLRINNYPNHIDAFFLGLSLGLGFLSKYAMVYFFICSLCYYFTNKNFQENIKNKTRYYLFSVLVFIVVFSPNIYWNLLNEWTTIFHTYENASLHSFNINIAGFISFIVAQIFIIGPFLFLTFIFFIKKIFPLSKNSLFLLCFSLPVLIIILIESLFVRAHGNWAAVAFVPLTILITSTLSIRKNTLLFFNNIFNMSLGLIFYFLIITNYNNGVFNQLKGYNDFSNKILLELKVNEISNIVIEDRMLYSLMSYYLKDNELKFFMPKQNSVRVSNHFQIKNSLPANFKEDFIFIGSLDNIKYLKSYKETKMLRVFLINKKFKNVIVYKYTFK